MGKKAVIGFIPIVIVIAIIAFAAMGADQNRMNELLDAGCVQVGVSGGSSAWDCPPGVD
jgi:hypothetical protein